MWLGVGAGGVAGRRLCGATVQFGMPQVNQQRVMATVTGRVTCSDTQRAARFATVTLIGTDRGDGGAGSGTVGFGFGRRVTARTDMDGNYYGAGGAGRLLRDGVGDGVCVAGGGGGGEVALGRECGRSAGDVAAGACGGGGRGTANITLDRGGVIQGKLQWDDGTPAAGVNVSVQSTTSAAGAPTDLTRVVSQLGGGFGGGLGGFQTSDDRGMFRITGLAPGSYWVRATMMTPAADPGSGMVQRMTLDCDVCAGEGAAVGRADGRR